MIATVCKSCRIVIKTITDRCRWCGSQHVEVKFVNETEIIHKHGHDYLRERKKKMSKPENVKCPECDGEMVSRKSQYGVFWGCKQFPKCKGTRDSMGRSKAEAKAERDAEKDNKEEDNSEWQRNTEDKISFNRK